jgi:ppGpp synthetase/RelA/SpoT-type nucleotidyltranferase
MAWSVPQYSRNKVNLAGEILIGPYQEGVDYSSPEFGEYWTRYTNALEIINNWRSAHNFPLNTFHIGLRRRALKIDAKCITAQRIKRLSSIGEKLSRFPTMTLSQMQDIAGCRAILSSVSGVHALDKAYKDSDIKLNQAS